MSDEKRWTGHFILLSWDQEAHLIQDITSSFEEGSPLSAKQLHADVHETFGLQRSRGWVWHLVHRHPEELEHAKAYLQQEAHVTVRKETARMHVTNLINDMKESRPN
jgi:hypothetical protein